MMLVIEVPTYESIDPATFKAIYGLQKAEAFSPVLFNYVRGYDCARARNEAVEQCIEDGADWLLFVDNDIVLPSDALLRLFKPLLSGEEMPKVQLGFYRRKNALAGESEVFRAGYKDYTMANNISYDELDAMDELIEVKGGGLGCALIDMSVFQVLPQPWFKYVTYDDGDHLSEDLYFCTNCKADGIAVYANTQLRCGHVSKQTRW